MTISSSDRKAGPYTGNGVTTAFAFAFKVFQASDLLVVRTHPDTLADTTLVLDTDYTVTLNSNQNTNPGGTVTLTTALASDYLLTIRTGIDYLQPTDLTNQGGFYPSVINNALDRLTIQIQQLKEMIDRAPLLSVASTLTSLQFPALEALRYLRANSAATGLEFASALVSSGTFQQSGTGAVEREANAKMAEQFSFTDFHAPEDGDDYTQTLVKFRNEIVARGSDVVGIIPPGRYAFRPHLHYSSANAWRAAVELTDVEYVTIYGRGATLVQDIPDTWTVGDAANYGNDEGPIQFRSTGNGTCHHINVVGLTVEMVKLAYSGGVGDGHAYGVAMRGVKDFLIRDVHVENAATDGIYIGPTYSNTYGGDRGEIVNSWSVTANRNGMSVVQTSNVKVMGGGYINTSGGSFQAGIDFEPDASQNQSNIVVCGVQLSGNAGRGATFIRTSNVKMYGCDVYNNGKDISVEGSCSRVKIFKNNITPNSTAGLGVDIIGNYNTDIDVEDNTVHMAGTPNLHVRVGYGGATGMRNVRVRGNTLIGEGGIDVRNVSGICQVNGNTHDVRLINGSLSDTNLFTWYIEPTTAEVNDNTIRIDSSITWAGTQNKFQIVNGTANRNKFDSHSGAVCVMYGRTAAFPVEYGYNEWSTYFYYDENLSSDAFRIKRKGSGIVYEGDTTYGRRIVTGGYARTTNINAVDNQVGDIAYNYGTTSGNPVAYRCTVAGTAGVSAGTWVGIWNAS